MVDASRVYRAIKISLRDILVMAREELAVVWKNLDKTNHYKAGRAQVYLKNVANRPQDYFSRANTEQEWEKRIRDYQKQGGFKSKDRKAVAYIVGGPAHEVELKAYPLFMHSRGSVARELLRDLLALVQEWEYKRTSKDKAEVAEADKIANKIFAMRERIESKKYSKKSNMAVWEMWKGIKRTFAH